MRKLVAVLFVLGMMAAACGDDGGGNGNGDAAGPRGEDLNEQVPGYNAASDTAEATGTAVEEVEPTRVEGDSFDLEIEMAEFRYSPARIRAIENSTGAVTLNNTDDVPHTFTSPKLDIDVEVAAGESEEIDVDLGEDLRYAFACAFHAEQGMAGSFATRLAE